MVNCLLNTCPGLAGQVAESIDPSETWTFHAREMPPDKNPLCKCKHWYSIWKSGETLDWHCPWYVLDCLIVWFLFIKHMPGMSSKISHWGRPGEVPIVLLEFLFVAVSQSVPCVEEQRVCPDDGKTYTFEELREAYTGALAFFWLVGVKDWQVAKHKWYRQGDLVNLLRQCLNFKGWVRARRGPPFSTQRWRANPTFFLARKPIESVDAMMAIELQISPAKIIVVRVLSGMACFFLVWWSGLFFICTQGFETTRHVRWHCRSLSFWSA